MKNPNLTPQDPHEQDAMTLRDYFAAKAMTMLQVPKGYHWANGQKDQYPEFAERAYKIADALLKERLKEHS